VLSEKCRPSPRSPSLSPVDVTRTLAGLTSRCMMRFECMYRSAPVTLKKNSFSASQAGSRWTTDHLKG